MGNYGPPVDQLLRIDYDFWDRPKVSHDYLGMGIGPEHIPELIRMATDPNFDDPDLEGPEIWAPAHAWRALGVLRAEQAIPTLVGIIALEADEGGNDLILEELPDVFARIGPAAIPDLTALFEREDAGEYAREDAAIMLVAIAREHPEVRERVVGSITRVLERAESQEPSFNGFLVSDLIDLEARESAEVIERAYAGGFVDGSICGDWYDVWHALKLEGVPPPRPANPRGIDPFFGFDEDFDDDLDDLDEGPTLFPNPSGWQPTELKTPDERKDRNKARQKLEKKVKGKGKGSKSR